jgi:hypothetical protein
MTAEDLLSEVRARGFEVRADLDNGRILIRPPGAMSEDLKERLRERKVEVLALLGPITERPANCLRPALHAHYWHDVPGLGWFCVAWACLPEEVRGR